MIWSLFQIKSWSSALPLLHYLSNLPSKVYRAHFQVCYRLSIVLIIISGP